MRRFIYCYIYCSPYTHAEMNHYVMWRLIIGFIELFRTSLYLEIEEITWMLLTSCQVGL